MAPDLIGSMLRAGARRTPRQPLCAEVRGGRALTYEEADVRANMIANSLLGLGMESGDRVAVWADDCIEYVEAYLAAARAGLVVVPVNARLGGDEAAGIVDDSGATVLVVSERLAPAAESTFSTGDLRAIVGIGDPLGHGMSFEDLVANGSPDKPPYPGEDDVAMLAYTSGTTGEPKGAMLTHRSVKNIARIHATAYRLPAGSVGVYTGSMSFPATVPAFLASHIYVGGTIHLLGRWDLELALATVEATSANWMYVPSPAVTDFANEVAHRPVALDSLTSILHSASKVSSEKMAALGAVVGSKLVEGWGLSENSGGLATATTARDYETVEADDIFGSVGRPTVDCELRILDPDGNDVPADGETVGELVIRTTALMKGYWRQPEATAEVMRDGWYHSGDLGYWDASGYIYISDRRTDLIVSGGMNVYPSEVEAVVLALPGVTGCAVVGTPDERWGQTVTAVIEGGPNLTKADVVSHVRAHLASYKKPTRVEFVTSLPRTVSDKVRRQAVRDQLSQAGPK